MAAPPANIKRLGREDINEIKDIDKNPGCSNPWSFKWCEKFVDVQMTVNNKHEVVRFNLKDCIVKVNIKGKALCTFCNVVIKAVRCPVPNFPQKA